MPIYESNGKKYNIPDDRVNDFVKSRSDAKLVDNTPYHLSRATSTPRQSNIQNQTDTQVEETPVQQPNNGIAGGFTTFKDGTSGFIPAMKMPEIKIEQPKIDISSAGTGKNTGLLQPFGKSKPLSESIGDAIKNMPIRPEAQFDMAQSTYKQNQDWVKEIQNDPSISPEVKQALLNDYNKNIRISDNTIEDKDLPLYAKKWLEENEVDIPASVYVQGSPMFGGGKYIDSTKKGNTLEQIAFIKDFIANTPQGQDLMNRQKTYVEYLENSISDVETRVPELKKKYQKEQYDLSRSHPYPMGKTKDKDETDAARKDYLEKYGALTKRMSALNLAEKNAEEQKKLLAAVKDGDLNVLSQFGKQIGRDFWEMAGDIGTLGIRPMMQSLYESSDVKGLQKRMESGEPLSEEDRLAMSALANNQAYQELMGDRRTIAQEVASGITQSAPFMVNFATTGGIGKAVTGGAKELLKQGIKRNAVNALRSGVNANTVKIGSRLAGFGLNVADVTGRASVMAAISPHTYRDMFDNMTGQVTYGYDEEGKPYYLGNIEQMDLANALLNAWGSNTIENVSEFSGFGMEKGQAALSRLLKQRVPEVAKALSFGSTRNQFFQGVNKAMEKAGFNGTANEFLEEQVSTILHSFFEDGQAQWSDLVDPRQQFITFLTVASIGSGSAIMNTGGNQLMKYGARKAYDNAFQDFGTEFYNSQNNDIAGQFADAVRNGTIEEKQNSLADIVNSDLFNDKQKLAALNLYRAGITYESYEGTKEAQVEEATQEIPAMIEENANPEMGAVVSATIAGMDTPVQIAGGNIVQNEDGTINREQSDQEIYYTDAEGKRQIVSIKYVENITENIPTQDAIAQVTEQVAAPIIAQQQNEEVRPYEAGETVRFSPDGNTSLIGQIDGQDQATGNYLLSVETPNGIQQMQVQPRQIINEDNLEGVENGSPVIYTNQNGEQVQAAVATTPDLYAQGLIGFENGDVVPVANVIGLANQSSVISHQSSQDNTDNMQGNAQQNEGAVPAEQNNVSNIEQIIANAPKQKNGKVDYNVLMETDPSSFAEVWEQRSGVEATKAQMQRVSTNIATQISSLQNKLEKETDFNKIADLEDSIAELEGRKQGIDAVITDRYAEPAVESRVETDGNSEENTDVETISDTSRENEQLWNVAENSEDPIDIASAYNEAMQYAGEEVLQEWQKQLLGRKINRASFERFGDRNYINGTIARSWFNRKGEETPTGSIDVIAQELGISEQNIIDFILDHPSNRIRIGNDLTQALNARFKEIGQVITGREIGGIESNSGRLLLSTLEYATNNAPAEQEQALADSNILSDIPQPVQFFLNDYMGLSDIEDFDQFRSAVEEADTQGYFVFPLEAKDKETILNYINNAEQQTRSVQGFGEAIPSESAIEDVEKPTIQDQIEQAEAETDINPTEAQKEAGNYKKGKVSVQGFDISIEQPKGSVRSGVDSSGKEWSVTMNNTYGYIRGTEGKDGDHIDVFLGANPESKTVFVVDQINQDQSFDEHKVMLGFDSIEQAREAYLSNYEEGWQGLGNITQTDIDTFKKWAKTDGRRIKPFADYKSIQGSKNEGSDFDISNYIGKELYHGSPDGEITKIDPYAHTQNWKEGIGFYTTESKDKAQEYANGKTANSKRKSDKGAITKITFPGDVKVLNMDAKVDIPLWKDISKNLGIETPLLSGSNLDTYNELISSYNDELGTTEGQYAIEEALLDYGYDASTHMEGLNSTPHRVFIWKNEFKLPYIGKVRLQSTNNVFKPINEQTFNSLIDRLKKTGLARDVVTDKAAFDTKLDEVINDNATAKQVLSEMDTIKQEAIANGTFMLAPNGRSTKLNENQWLQVRTKPFLDWFGDWINNPEAASKVVDDNGEPMVVYHGTNNVRVNQQWNDKTKDYDKTYEKFTVFDNSEFDTLGHFFTDDKNNAEGYGNEVYDSYLNLKNPLTIDANGSSYSDVQYNGESKDTYEWTEWAKENGYDGVIFNNIRDGVDYGYMAEDINDYVAFTPNQIKSAISNNGEFDSSNPDIRMQVLEDSTNTSSLKEKQLATVLKYNPAPNDINTWVRSADDILTAEEAFKNTLDDNSDFFEDSMYPDFTADDMRNALDAGEITVYSSYPIKKGVFITPSRMNAEGYAGEGKIYSKTVKLTDVAWIDESEGQYTPVKFMRTNRGDVYGFVTSDGTVYLDSTRMNANTPIHEFGHLWNSFTKENDSELYNRGTELVKESEYWQRVNDNPSYRNLSDEAKVDEALAMAIGDKGEAIVNRSLKKRFVDWVKDVWNSIKETFGVNADVAVEDMTLSEFTDLAVDQLLGGKNLVNNKKNNNFDKNNNNDKRGTQETTTSRLDNRQAVGGSAIRELVAEPERRDGISRTITSSNSAGIVSAIQEAYEREELEARGINPDYDKTEFRKELRNQAKNNGVWLEKSFLDDKTLLHDRKAKGTSENDVYVNEDGKTYTKINNLSFITGAEKGNNLLSFVDRLESHNTLFPNAAYTIKGFMDNKEDIPSMVLEQPEILSERNATQEEIDEYLSDIGFKKDGTRKWSNGHEVWSNGVYELFDARPANVLMGKDGNLYFIDTIPHSVEYMETDGSDDIEDGRNIRFQSVNDVADAAESTMTEDVKNKLNKELNKTAHKIAEAWFDRWLPVKKLLQTLEKSGLKIEDHNNWYLRADAVASSIQSQYEGIFYNDYMLPILESISSIESKGYTLRDIENYAMLKGGLERNELKKSEEIEKYKAEHPDATKEQIESFEQQLPSDYAGVTAIEEEVGVPSDKYISDFEQNVGNDLITEFWKKKNAATNYTLKRIYETGGISKSEYEKLLDVKYYIPLRGHDIKTAEDLYDYAPNMGVYFSNPMIKANGRRTRAENPFVYIDQMGLSAIKFANWNSLNQSLYRLAAKDKTNTLTRDKAWYVQTGISEDGTPIWESQEPVYSENSEQYRKNQDEFEKRMLELQKEGLAMQQRGRFDLGGLFIKPTQREQHRVSVWVNGNEHSIYINANPAIARSINATNLKQRVNDEQYKEGILKAAYLLNEGLGKTQRWMANNITSKSPEFLMRNLMRDVIQSATILPIKEGMKYEKDFLTNLPKSAAALSRYLVGKSNISNPTDAALVNFFLNGGATGYVHFLELQKNQKKINKEISDLKKSNFVKTYGFLKYIPDSIEAANKWAENLSRFAVYLTSMQQGRSIVRSISDAKEVTVNFNRTGSGKMGNSLLRNNYMFINPALQAMYNMAGVASKNRKKFTALTIAFGSLGFIAPMLSLMIGGDDGWDEYWNLSEWDRQNNFCIYTGNGFVKISLPQELRVFTRIGDNLFSAILGKKDKTEASIDSVLGFADLSPVNPLGASTDDVKNWSEGGLLAKAMPDRYAPFVELAVNKNFADNRIYNQYANKNSPGHKQSLTNKKGDYKSPDWLVDFSKALNDITGGDDVSRGVISLNPDKLNHLLRSYLGGMYTTAAQAADVTNRALDPDKKVEIRNTPLRAVYISSADIQSSGNPKYFDIQKEIDKKMYEIKGYQKEVEQGKLGIDDFVKKLNSLDHAKILELDKRIKQIKKYESALKELDGQDQKDLEKIISDLKKEVIEVNNKLSE